MTFLTVLSKILYPIFGADQNYKVKAAVATDSEDEHQNGTGAPVEGVNPLGYHIDYVTAFYMVIQGIIGTGIFLNPGSILKSIGSVGASYVLWVVGFFIAIFEVFVYIEYLTYFKKRSGGLVAYLEQAYPKPDFLVPTTFAAVSVFLSFIVSSAIAFGTYVSSAAGLETSTWVQRGIGAAALTSAALLSAVSTQATLRLSNFLGFVKIVFLLFIIISGLAVLGGGTRVENSHANFKNAWEGTTNDGNAISNAIIKVSFSYNGTQYLFGMAGEVDPKKSKNMFRYFIPFVLVSVFIIYILIVTAYFAGGGNIEQQKKAGTLISSVFFANVFGTKAAKKALDSLVALAAFGHLSALMISNSRSLREIGRQGVVPYPRLWASTKPWGTPLFPIFITWLINLIVLIAPPAGDAYNLIVDIGSYSGYIFKIMLIIGIVLVRRQRKAAGLGYEGWKVPMPIIVITTLFYAFVIVMAWVPPNNGSLNGSDVNFLYCTYAITAFGIIFVCVAYYFVWARVLPKIGKYEHRKISYEENGVKGHTVVQVKVEDLEKWDLEHDDDRGILVTDSDSQQASVENISLTVSKKE